MKKVLVTGANGFVGRECCRFLAEHGIAAAVAVRGGGSRVSDLLRPLAEVFEIGEVGPDTSWNRALAGVDTVIHLANRAHVMNENPDEAITVLRRVNVAGTAHLARSAAEAGVRRLIYVSSVKVNGERTSARPFTELDPPGPEDPYGHAKREAEECIRLVARESGLETVIIRPPLLYGPGVKGNFLRLLKLIDRGIPLPLASVSNCRSLLGVGNLVDLIARCIDHPAAAGEVFLASDGEDLSTPELVRRMADALGRPARMIRFPVSLLRRGASLLGRLAEFERLCGSLVLDSSKVREVLGWTAPLTMEMGLKETAGWFRKNRAGTPPS